MGELPHEDKKQAAEQGEGELLHEGIFTGESGESGGGGEGGGGSGEGGEAGGGEGGQGGGEGSEGGEGGGEGGEGEGGEAQGGDGNEGGETGETGEDGGGPAVDVVDGEVAGETSDSGVTIRREYSLQDVQNYQTPWSFGMTNMRDRPVSVAVNARSTNGAGSVTVALFNEETGVEVNSADVGIGSPVTVLFTDVPDGMYRIVFRVNGGTADINGRYGIPDSAP
jgi:hypothetical protein